MVKPDADIAGHWLIQPAGDVWRKGKRTFTPHRPLYKVENVFARLGMWRQLSRCYEQSALGAQTWLEVACVAYLCGRLRVEPTSPIHWHDTQTTGRHVASSIVVSTAANRIWRDTPGARHSGRPESCRLPASSIQTTPSSGTE